MPTVRPSRRRLLRRLLLFALVVAAPLAAVAPPQPQPSDRLALRHPNLYIGNVYQPLAQLPPLLTAALRQDLTALGAPAASAYYDLRGARWGTLVLRQPLVPGPGKGNTLTWQGLGLSAPAGDEQYGAAVWSAFRQYLTAHQAQLDVDPAELAARAGIAVHGGRRLVQIHAPRVVAGVPVRGSYLTAAVNGGNLVLLGARNWGPVDVSTQPSLTSQAAADVVRAHLGREFRIASFRRPAGLALVPLSAAAANADLSAVVPGTGYDYRLVWVISPSLAGSHGSWEALVDAHTAELLAFADQNHYFDDEVVGGVYPVSNDGQVPDGIEQPGFPMPFAEVTQTFRPGTVTNSAGLAFGVGSQLGTSLSGPYVHINDSCGGVREAGRCTLDLGTSGGTDCAVPPGGSPGNTHSARSGFYEINRIVEAARGQLPGNAWLQRQLTANMNLASTCNAFWNGSTINFYRSGGGCANTGEIAAVFDHEWGHGMDNNDVDGQISAPGEAIADIFGLLRLNDSCFGRGFRPGVLCDDFGDACLTCTGVRELDYAKHASAQPHGVTWILTPTVAPGGGCVGVPGTQFGPCNQETHCEGMVPAEAGWDLVHRDLAATLDFNTALEVATRLIYRGAGNVGNWYQCSPGPTRMAGCNADGGYLNLLAADDDNGDLTDGTPHMPAIFAAFDRHEIACATPAVLASGCAGGPTQAPALTATAGANAAELSWTAVAGATRYAVYRTEGVKGCDFGKAKIAETTDTQFTDSGLRAGFQYFYSVLPVAANDACMGRMSACTAVVPLAGQPAAEARAAFREVAGPLAILSGDGDGALDNCEHARFRFEVENAGGIALHNVRLTAVVPLSHPEIQVVTPLPVPLAATLPAAACDDASGIVPASFSFRAQGLAANQTVEFRVEVAADELPAPLAGTIRLTAGTEVDLQFVASHTFGFESDLEGWSVVQGTFQRTTGQGAGGTLAYLASSSLASSQCDQIRSPRLHLTAGSTLSLFDQFEIEPETPTQGWFDRANVALFDPAAGERIAVLPDGGRVYNADGPNGQCVTQGLPGWAGLGTGWAESTWSAGALQAPGLAGRPLYVDVAYGTDPTLEGTGFRFDQVRLTDFYFELADGQPDQCPAVPPPLARDDAAATTLSTPVTIPVTANDTTANPPLALSEVADPAHGTAAANADGSVTYTPDPGFLGDDSFEYTVCDASGLCDTALASVAVRCPETATGSFADDFEPAPAAGWATRTAANGLPTSVTWTAATDPFAQSPSHSFFSDATTLHVKDDRLISPPQDLSPSSRLAFWHRYLFESGFDGGVLELSRDGGATWVDVLAGGGAFLAGGYDGTISPNFGSAIAGRPAWTVGSEFIDAMSRVEVDLGAFAGRGVLVRWRLVTDPLALSLPGLGWWIDDVQFTNTLETPSACPMPPVATDDAASTQEGQPVTVAVLVNDTDPNGDPLTVTGVTAPSNGSASHDGTVVTYTPAAGFAGSDGFEYTACDPGGLCDGAAVTVTVAAGNRPPVAADDAANTAAGTPVTIAVLANDSDPDGDPLALAGVADPPHGTATANPDGTVTYTPDAGFSGTDTFDYTASDGEAADTGTVSVLVEAGGGGEPTRAGGSGAIADGAGLGRFHFDARSNALPRGRLSYGWGDDDEDGFEVKGTVSELTFPTASRAELSGPCELGDGSPCRYEVAAEDHGQPGSGNDRFEIRVFSATGALLHQAAGTPVSGNVKIR